MLSSKIEQLAVLKISTMAAQPNSFLNPRIPINDKDMTFDGEIIVLKEETGKVESYEGKVHVQVKGQKVEKYSSPKAKYQVFKKHLLNYRQEDGVVFIKGEILHDGNVQLFYKSILNLDIEKMLRKMGNKKSLTIYLEQIQGVSHLRRICKKFLEDKRLQPGNLIGRYSIDSESIQNIKMVTVNLYSKKNPIHAIEDDLYIYGEIDGIDFPLGIATLGELGTTREFTVKINGADIIYGTNIKFTKTHIEIDIEESINVSWERETKRFKLENIKKPNLESYHKCLLLLKELQTDKNLTILEGDLEISNFTFTGDIETIEKEIAWCEMAKSIFTLVGIPYNYPIDGEKKSSILTVLPSLKRIFVDGNLKDITLPSDKQSRFLRIKAGEDQLLTFYKADNKKQLLSVADPKYLRSNVTISKDDDKTHYKASVFMAAEAPHLLSSANVTLNLVKDTFTPANHSYSNETFDLTNLFALNLLNEYDKTSLNDNLELAIFIFDNMLKSQLSTENYQIAFINHLQAVYRKSSVLSNDENTSVIEIREHPMNKENLLIKFCCHVLLEQIQDATYFYDKMEDEARVNLKDYPIYKLYEEKVIA